MTQAPRPFTGRIVRPELAAESFAAPDRESLRQLSNNDLFSPSTGPTAVLYGVHDSAGDHGGLVVEVPTSAYGDGRVKRHEGIRAEKAERFVQRLHTFGASSTPSLLVHRPITRLAGVRDELVRIDPVIDVEAAGGVRHTIRASADPDLVAELERGLAEITELYIADGHHRIDAAHRFAARYFLAAVAALSDVRILPFHRLVTDVDRSAVEAVRGWLVERGATRIDSETDVAPARPGECLVRLDGAWHRVHLDRPSAVDQLDAVALQEQVLAPLFGITDPGADPRLEFVSSHEGPEGIERRCHDAPAVGFLLHPPAIDQVLAVADAGETMPPKSTWFEPKLSSGLLRHAVEPANDTKG
jgi:uncharacterized protein (DUF1015 family)